MANRSAVELVIVCCSVQDGALNVLARAESSPRLPRAAAPRGTRVDAAAATVARATLGHAPTWLAQVHAETRDGGVDVLYAATVSAGTPAPAGCRWMPVSKQRTLGEASASVTQVLGCLRDRMDLEPIAFHLLPTQFTLAELQAVYELLLGHRLHKASFRRALAGAYLVVPTDQWRSEGRGRPAQLFRYAPRRGRAAKRPVRFDLLA